MKKRKARVIKDPKARGEWVESVFMARAGEHGLAVSKPWGDSKTYDFVVGRPGHFVGVQVKSTMVEAGGGYACFVRKQNEVYARGSFDFLAAYVIPEDAWYIIPADKIRGKGYVSLFSDAETAKYEQYREAWQLLKEAAEVGGGEAESHASRAALGLRSGQAPGEAAAAGDDGSCSHVSQKRRDVGHPDDGQTGAEKSPVYRPGSIHPGNPLQRLEWIANRMRAWAERSNPRPEKGDDAG